jgi:hypothetical protein
LSLVSTSHTTTGLEFGSTVPNAINAINGAGNDFNTALRISNLGNASASAVMTFEREGVFGVHFGLDTDNVLKYGGFSEGANAYQIWTDKNGAARLAVASPDLGAIEALGGTGFATRTAADTWAQRAIAVSGGLTISNPLGVAGDPSVGTDGTFFRVTQTTTFSGIGATLRTSTPNAMSAINGAGNNDKTALTITNAGNGSASALMSFHREGVYAVHFGLDTNNELRYGGWSEGTNVYDIWTDKNGAAKLAAGVKAAIDSAYASTQNFSGRVEMADGFFLQWVLSGIVADDANYGLSWPSAFPNACYNVTGSVLNPTTGNDDVFLRVISYDVNGATVRAETAGSPNGASRQLMLWGIGR